MLKKIEPWGFRVDLSRLEPTNPQPGQLQPEALELEATDYRELPDVPVGDRPQSPTVHYRGIIGAISGLLILVGFTLSVGAVSGAVYHRLQDGGDSCVRR